MDRIEPPLVIRYAVPMKKGDPHRRSFHHHFALKGSDERQPLTRARVISAFGPTERRPDVAEEQMRALERLGRMLRRLGPCDSGM
jgi:hypothetical protein